MVIGNVSIVFKMFSVSYPRIGGVLLALQHPSNPEVPQAHEGSDDPPGVSRFEVTG